MRKALALFGFFVFGLLSSCSQREKVVSINTEFGEIILILFDQTPQHKRNFLELARGRFYDSTTFHRVIDGFIIQGGDPNTKDEDKSNDGRGGPGYTIPAEFVEELTHKVGAVAAARQPDAVTPEKSSSGSQLYIVDAEFGAHFLDGNYTVFGQVIQGMDVVHKIARQPRTPSPEDRPLKDIVMTVEVKSMSKKKITKEYGYEFPPEK